MKYFVTYCTMDQRLANPFWHACLLLSKQPDEGERIQVTNAWGFYPAPMALSDSLVTKLKKFLGFNFDLCGNFGVWKTEELRYLDLGYGLHGVTFEVTHLQYQQLKRNYLQTKHTQETAIAEIKARLEQELIDPDSIAIYQEELRLAQEEDREPRLSRFDFLLSLSINGVTLEQSNTCKNMALDALRAVNIAEALLDSITGVAYTSFALPRMSGEVEDIYLYSEGPRYSYQSKRSNQVTLFRTWEDRNDKLFWTLPPLVVRQPKGDVPFLDIPIKPKLLTMIKDCIGKLQRVEAIVANAGVNVGDIVSRSRLQDHLVDKYRYFSTLSSNTMVADIKAHLADCDLFLGSLYSAINDNWDDGLEVVSIASRFDNASQIKICDALGLDYDQDRVRCCGMF